MTFSNRDPVKLIMRTQIAALFFAILVGCSMPTRPIHNLGGESDGGDVKSSDGGKLDAKTVEKLIGLMQADKSLLPVQLEGAKCSAGDRAVCACGAGSVGIQSCTDGAFSGSCACETVAVLGDSSVDSGTTPDGGVVDGGVVDGGVVDGGAAATPDGAVDGGPGCSPDNPCAKFTANADGTVTDATTGLTWMGDLGGAAGLRYFTGNADVVCPKIGGPQSVVRWRLPTLHELQTLLNSRYYPDIDPHFFPAAPPGAYWTSDAADVTAPWASSSPGDPTACAMGIPTPCSGHLTLDFNTTTVAAYSDLFSAYVRCVR